MSQEITIYAYVVAAVLFVFALKAMASHKTARRGNLIGAIGMLIAILATLLAQKPELAEDVLHGNLIETTKTISAITTTGWVYIIIGGIIGSAIGAFLALTVHMTAMPQMVAMFNGTSNAEILVLPGQGSYPAPHSASRTNNSQTNSHDKYS